MASNFDDWLGTLPKWLQTGAAMQLSATLNDTDICLLADLCLAETCNTLQGAKTVPAGHFDVGTQEKPLRLREIKDIQGVNALHPGASLQFENADITVVYGHNGTGKSSFARLTKQTSAGRARSKILSNVFHKSSTEPAATFIIDHGGTQHHKTWSLSTGPLEELKNLHVFDNEVASSYINDTAEARYEPRRLRFITALVLLSDRTKAELQRRVDLLTSQIPTLPSEFINTPLAKKISNFKHSTSDDEFRNAIQRTPSHQERLSALEDVLRVPEPDARVPTIDKLIEQIDTAFQSINSLSTALSPENVTKLTEAKDYAILSRENANAVATTTFESSSLVGVGEPLWQAMWEAARRYSTTIAYPGQAFPHVENGLCPLCQQELGETANQRMLRFEEYIRSEITANAEAAEAFHKQLIEQLPKLPSLTDWKNRFVHLNELEETIETVHQQSVTALEKLASARRANDIDFVNFSPIKRALESLRSERESEKKLLLSTHDRKKRDDLQAELLDLRTRDWYHTNLDVFLKELARKRKVAQLEAAIKSTNTTNLTKKKNELTSEELTGGYQQRFESELQALGAARLRVKPVEAKASKGRVSFGLTIVGAVTSVTPADVLSEGESRIAALAAFLADVTVAGANTPFLFDDPISSLDIEFEEKVAKRLIELSRTRQVLVFTHRLSLLTLLADAVEKENKAAKELPSIEEINFKQVALRRMGDRIGLITDTNVLESRVDKALNQILNNRLPEAKKAFDNAEVELYTTLMKSICSDVRILAERAVEEVLLAGVVGRFRRSVQTMNKIMQLAKISDEDCLFIDGIMTRFSVFEHSQPAEMPALLPSHEDVRKDVVELGGWVVEFRGRTKN